jgi:hypothetical protein
MKPDTESRRQWFWFVALSCGGLLSALLLAYAARLVISVF